MQAGYFRQYGYREGYCALCLTDKIMKLLSILLAIACSLLVPVTGYMALFAGMAMDAPGSEKSIGKKLFVLTLMASPFALLWAAITSWKRIAVGDYGAALLWCPLSLIPFAVAMFLLHFDWFEKK